MKHCGEEMSVVLSPDHKKEVAYICEKCRHYVYICNYPECNCPIDFNGKCAKGRYYEAARR